MDVNNIGMVIRDLAAVHVREDRSNIKQTHKETRKFVESILTYFLFRSTLLKLQFTNLTVALGKNCGDVHPMAIPC